MTVMDRVCFVVFGALLLLATFGLGYLNGMVHGMKNKDKE